jgi:hypothetical protein
MKQPQYVEETVYGETPDSPTFIHAGPMSDMEESIEIDSIPYRQIGSRDLYSMIKTGENYSFDITLNPISEDLIKYAIDLPNGTGTIEKSLTFVKSQKINGVELYTVYKGCRCDSIDIEIASDSAVEVSMSFLCKEITTPAASPGFTGTPTYASNPTDLPWTNLSPGSGPLTINSLPYDTSDFSCSITQNLEATKPNGELQPKWVDPTLREVEFEVDVYYKDVALITDTKGLTARSMEYKLSSNKKLVFTDAYLEELSTSDETGATEAKVQSISGTAKSVAIATWP